MPPKPFYEIDPKTYLFGKSVTPEERVRQWAIFELLSTYGYNINDIQVEVPCKIGSKYFPADVVVYKNRIPFIVVECKRKEYENQAEALEQAKSYAGFLKAVFVIFTNGEKWFVKRNEKGEWKTVSDLPYLKASSSKRMINETFGLVEVIKPLLYWVYRSVPKENAHKFFEKLLYFIQSHVEHEILNEMNVRRSLYYATERLLCVIGAGSVKTVKDFDQDGYKINKLKEAIHSAEEYLESIGHELIYTHNNLDGYYFKELLEIFGELNYVPTTYKDLPDYEVSFLRLIKSVTIYIWEVYEAKEYVEIKENLMREVENLLGQTIKLGLNSELPDSIDVTECDIMRSYSSGKWIEK